MCTKEKRYKMNIKIDGMTCAGCSSAVERDVLK